MSLQTRWRKPDHREISNEYTLYTGEPRRTLNCGYPIIRISCKPWTACMPLKSGHLINEDTSSPKIKKDFSDQKIPKWGSNL